MKILACHEFDSIDHYELIENNITKKSFHKRIKDNELDVYFSEFSKNWSTDKRQLFDSNID